MLDMLIKEATIYDGTGKISFVADVGIRGDKIVSVQKDIQEKAKNIIQAKGFILSPGFIDIHSHSDYFLLINPTADSKITQGVTTEVGGNCGYSAAPIWGEAQKRREEEYQKYYNLKLGWSSLSEYFKRLEDTTIALNYAHLIGHNTLRQSAMGSSNRAPTTQELSQMKKGVEEGMKEGAVGISTGLIYPPACYSKTEEVVALANVCKKSGGIFTFHMRSESDRVVEAIQEVLTIARGAKIPVQISHVKTSGQRNWHKIKEIFGLIEKAQQEGLDVECDRYPYAASQTGLMQVLPDWTFEGGAKGLVQTLKDSKNRKKIKEEVMTLHPPSEEYLDKVLIMEVMSEKNKQFEGLTVQKAAQKAKKEVFEFLFDLLIEEEAAVSAIYFTMSEENLKNFLKKDYIFIASDSGARATHGPLAKGKPHPRIFGTFPRVVRKYVREEKFLDLATAIYKMTYQPARRFGLEKRGKIKVGYFADVVLFDFNKIADKADFLDPFHYCEGIEYVFVNGEIALEKGKQTKTRAGRVLRRHS